MAGRSSVRPASLSSDHYKRGAGRLLPSQYPFLDRDHVAPVNHANVAHAKMSACCETKCVASPSKLST